jgi:hypothetical protein
MEIKVTNKKTYKGQKENWTESKTRSFRLKKDLVCIHKSERKIKSFQSGITTCVYDEIDSKEQLNCMTYEQAKQHNIVIDYTHFARPSNNPDFVYKMVLPAGTYVEEYDNEYRFQMNESVKISLIGTMGRVKIKDSSLHPYECDVYGGKFVNVYTKKF